MTELTTDNLASNHGVERGPEYGIEMLLRAED